MTDILKRELLYHVDIGEGPAVIFIHGMAASMYDWTALMPKVASCGYHTYAVDLLGHGDSAKPSDPEIYTLKSVYATLEDWIDGLPEEPPYILVGHSLGGYLSLHYALRNPDAVCALVLIDPLYSLEQLSPLLKLTYRRVSLGIKALQWLSPQMIDFFMGWDPTSRADFSPQTRLKIAIDYKRASPYILNIPRTIPDLTPALDQIASPALVIWGNKDLTLKPSSFPQLVSILPKGSGREIRGLGHLPHIGSPGLVNPLILDYINTTC